MRWRSWWRSRLQRGYAADASGQRSGYNAAAAGKCSGSSGDDRRCAEERGRNSGQGAAAAGQRSSNGAAKVAANGTPMSVDATAGEKQHQSDHATAAAAA
eukprot:4444244-Lingulodinium_polyedra.AAC.1